MLGAILLLFFGWYTSWHGRPLDDAAILQRLDPASAPREIEHALIQLGERLAYDHPGRERFRPKLLALVDHPAYEVRQKVALLMGREPAPEYHAALLEMIRDPDPSVRRNAACALSNFNDAAARPALLETLEPIKIPAPAAGRLDLKLKPGDTVSTGRAIGMLTTEAGQELEVRASFGGHVESLPKGREGAVAKDDVIVVVSPDPQSVLNVLVALKSVGTPADIAAIRPYADGQVARMGPDVAQQAGRTIQAIAAR